MNILRRNCGTPEVILFIYFFLKIQLFPQIISEHYETGQTETLGVKSKLFISLRDIMPQGGCHGNIFSLGSNTLQDTQQAVSAGSTTVTYLSSVLSRYCLSSICVNSQTQHVVIFRTPFGKVTGLNSAFHSFPLKTPSNQT